MTNMTASHRPQAHAHHQRPARSISSSVASSSGPPSTTASASPLARSARYSPGVVRLKPKRASRRNVRHSDSGRFTSWRPRAMLAMTARPSHGCARCVWRHSASMSAIPPPTVSIERDQRVDDRAQPRRRAVSRSCSRQPCCAPPGDGSGKGPGNLSRCRSTSAIWRAREPQLDCGSASRATMKRGVNHCMARFYASPGRSPGPAHRGACVR